jgi:hypothetical protein
MNGKRLVVLTLSAIALAIPSLALRARPTMAQAIEAASGEDDGDKNGNANGLPVIREQVLLRPVQWTLTPARCSLLQTDLTGSGQGRKTVTLLRNPGGTFNYKINDEVSGIATDRNNHHYIFLYANNSFVGSGTGFPLPQPPYNVYGTDEFRLIPVDGGTGYTTNIFFKAGINADGSFTDQGSVFTPNAFCDPI